MDGGFAIMAIEFGGIPSTIFFGWVSDRVGGRRGMVAALCMVPIIAAFGVMVLAPASAYWLSMTMLVAIVLAVRLWAQPPVKVFQGYWMGVDPLDGGDSRRGIVQQDDGTFAMAGRDSFLTLCDNSDRGIATFDNGVVVSRRVMTTDNLKLSCFGTGALVLLRARYELVGDSVMIETLAAQDGSPVDRIVFHKVSRD